MRHLRDMPRRAKNGFREGKGRNPASDCCLRVDTVTNAGLLYSSHCIASKFFVLAVCASGLVDLLIVACVAGVLAKPRPQNAAA